MKILRLMLLFVALQTASARQSATGVVEGIVARAGSNEPVARAVVELRRGGAAGADPKPYTITTVDDGKFSFRSVPPGQYQLAVSKPGYVSALLGQRRPNGPAETIPVAGGDTKGGYRVVLTPAGTISGRLTEPSGRPLVNAEVTASLVAYPQGRRTFRSVQTTITDDLGEYRLFWLPPGEYYVSTVPLVGDRGFRLDNDGSDQLRDARMRQPTTALPTVRPAANVTAQIYYPGTLDMDGAAAVSVRAGLEFRGVDFVASPPPVYHIRVVAIDALTGQPVTGPRAVNIVSSGSGAGVVAPGGTGPFDFPAAVPGRYAVTVTAGEMRGRVNVEVRNQDVAVTIPVALPFDIPGRVRIEGPPPPKPVNLAALRINTPYDPFVGAPPPQTTVAADGSFTLKVATGDYRLNLAPPQPGVYLKSVLLGNVDVLNNGLRINGQPEGTMEIVLAGNVASVQGRVIDDSGQPAREVTVALVPDPAYRRRNDLFKTAVTDAAGIFQLSDLAPGDYKIFAWEDVEAGAWLDPAFLRTQEDRGRPVRVAEGSRQSVDVVVGR